MTKLHTSYEGFACRLFVPFFTRDQIWVRLRAQIIVWLSTLTFARRFFIPFFTGWEWDGDGCVGGRVGRGRYGRQVWQELVMLRCAGPRRLLHHLKWDKYYSTFSCIRDATLGSEMTERYLAPESKHTEDKIHCSTFNSRTESSQVQNSFYLYNFYLFLLGGIENVKKLEFIKVRHNHLPM